jgi:hypothetical protein
MWIPSLDSSGLPILGKNLSSPVAGAAPSTSAASSTGGARAAAELTGMEPPFGVTAGNGLHGSVHLGVTQPGTTGNDRINESLHPLYAIAAVAAMMPPQSQQGLYERPPNW